MHTVTFILENAYGYGQVKSRLWMFPTYILTSLLTQNAPKLLIHHIEIHDGQTKNHPYGDDRTIAKEKRKKMMTMKMLLMVW